MANVTETSSSNPKIINYNNNPLPTIKVPFPPEINAKDLIAHRESPDGTKKLTTRAPNAFIIFRKQFVKTARDEGHFLPMTVISSMASVAWENEREEVRAEYKRIAREAHVQRKAMCPKSNNRRKRKEKWNLVSFIPSTSVNKPGSKMISNKSTTNIITAGNGNNNVTGNTTNNHIINNHNNNHITNDLLPVKSEPDTITCHEINENYFAQYYPNLSYTSYNENSDLSYNSYNESPNLSYTSYNDDNTSPNTNININTNINTNPNTDLYGNTEQYPSPYLMGMGIPTINIPDDDNNNNNNNNDNHDLQEYNSIIENNIQQNNLYNDDDNWNLENGIISNFSASPSNSFSDFTSNASSSPSIASPSIISLDTPTSALATSDFTDFTDFTFNNTTPIITQNNYEIMDFSSIYNDTIMQPLIMMQ